MQHSTFPDSVKVASVVPLDKGKPTKHYVSNFTPVSILNNFSKILE